MNIRIKFAGALILCMLQSFAAYAGSSIDFGDKSSAIRVVGPSTTFKIATGTLVINDGSVFECDGGSVVGDLLFVNSNCTDLTETTSPGGIIYLRGNDSFFGEPNEVNAGVIANGKNNRLSGYMRLTGPICLQDVNTTLTIAIYNTMNQNVKLRNGTIILENDFGLADDVLFTGSGTVDFNGYRVLFGGGQLNWPDQIFWKNANDLALHSKMTVTGIWYFSGNSHITGNGNLVDLTNGGSLWIKSGATLYIADAKVKGLGSGRIVFEDDTSQLKLSQVEVEMDGNITWTIGGVYVEGPTTIVTRNRTLTLSDQASMTVDNVGLNYDTLNFGSENNIQPIPSADPNQKFIAYVNDGVIRKLVTERVLTTHSNAMLYLTKNNSNALLACCKNNSNTLLFLAKNNSNALLAGDKNNSNALLYLTKNNSNALVFFTTNTNSPIYKAISANSNTLLYLTKNNSNALLFCCTNNSNALVAGDKNNSNALLYLTKNNSNALLRLFQNNSQALISCCKNNSNTLLFLVKNLSNALLAGDKNNSNTLLYLTKNNSNALLRLFQNNSQALISCCKNNSNTLLFLVKNLSNALLAGDKNNSNTLLYLTKNNSNALLRLFQNNSQALISCCKNNSNTLLFLVKNLSNALLAGDKNNSNTLLYLTKNNSNALLRLFQNNSQALISCCKNNSNTLIFLTKNNSNALLRLFQNNSQALISCCKNNSNTLLFLAKNNSNALLRLFQNNSQALISCCKNNSNTLLFLTKNNSNALLRLFQNNSQALLYLTKNNSNTLLYCCKNNSMAIVWLDAQLDTIDHGPWGVTIDQAPTHTLSFDIFLSASHTLLVTVDTTINGSGHAIKFARKVSNQFRIQPGVRVVLENVVLRDFDDEAITLMSPDSEIIFGNCTKVELSDCQDMTKTWTFAGDALIYGDNNVLNIADKKLRVLQPGRLTIENALLDNVRNNNICCVGPNARLAYKSSTIHLSHDYTFSVGSIRFIEDNIVTGTKAFVYTSTGYSMINNDAILALDKGVTFSYAPATANRDLIALQDRTAKLFLNGCTLVSSMTGMRLTSGTLCIDHNNFLRNTGATSASQGFAFGNGTTAQDLDIQMFPGGSVELLDGVLDYANIDA